MRQQFEAYEAAALSGTTRPPYRFPDIDLQTPTSLPTQKQISRALHRIAAADLMQDLVASAPVAALWINQTNKKWPNTMPYVNRVAAKTWRTMFCLCMMALIPRLLASIVVCLGAHAHVGSFNSDFTGCQAARSSPTTP